MKSHGHIYLNGEPCNSYILGLLSGSENAGFYDKDEYLIMKFITCLHKWTENEILMNPQKYINNGCQWQTRRGTDRNNNSGEIGSWEYWNNAHSNEIITINVLCWNSKQIQDMDTHKCLQRQYDQVEIQIQTNICRVDKATTALRKTNSTSELIIHNKNYCTGNKISLHTKSLGPLQMWFIIKL